MDFTEILSYAAILLNWAIALVGMPHQIYKNFKEKKVEGLSTFTFSLYVIAFGFGLLYGLSIENRALIFGNIPLLILSAIILFQVVYYKKRSAVTF